MTSLLVAFLTGLTTGGLSCMAVQGGLLASSLANQIEQYVSKSAKKKGKRTFKLALPILFIQPARPHQNGYQHSETGPGVCSP